jgi:hypothetical protein
LAVILTIFGSYDEHTQKYRQNFIYIHAWIVVVQTCIVSETTYCDWSHELDGNGVPESTMGQMLGSDVAGRIAGKFEEYDRVPEIRDEAGRVEY